MVETAATAPPAEELDPRRWLALAVIAVAALMFVLDATIVSIALPSADRTLHISTANRQWVLTAYLITFGGLLLLGGRIADFAGRKRVLIIGLLGFAVASALGGVAQNQGMLFAARALQGAFAALMAPASLALISVTFTEARERATAFGVYGAISGGGAALGLILGGLLTEYASWRWCFLINLPVSVLAAIAAARIVHESRAEGSTRYDIPGAISVTLGIAFLVYGFTKASQSGWGATATVVSLCIAGALLLAFFLIEARSSAPLLPSRVVLDRNRGGSFIASFLTGMALYGMFLFLTFYLQTTLHYSALKAGLAFLPFSAGIIVSAGLASKVLPRVGPRIPMVGGFFLATIGIIWLTQIGLDTTYVSHVLPSEVVMSIGFGFVFVPMSSTALLGVGQRDAGVASATLNATQQVGGSLGTALLNTIAATATTAYITAHGVASAAEAVVHGYSVGFWVGAGLLAAAGIITFALVRARPEELALANPALAGAEAA